MRNNWRKLFLSWLPKLKRVPESLEGKGLVFAFKAGGKRFYRWKDIEAMPVLRMMIAKDYFEQLETGAHKEDVQAYIATVKNAINEPNLDRAKLAVITEQLEKRTKYITNVDLLYRLSAIYYVTKDDFLPNISIEQVEDRADFFKDSMPIDDFFLNARLRDFLPHGSISDLNLNTYSKAEIVERKERLTSLLLLNSSLTAKDETLIMSLKQRISTLQK